MATNASLVTVAALAFSGSATIAASAASPAYCALYAREYAIDTVQPAAAIGLRQSVEDQAYYRCLNQDDDPPLPTASAYFEAPELLLPRMPAPRVDLTPASAAAARPAERTSPRLMPTAVAPSWIRWTRSNAAKPGEAVAAPAPGPAQAAAGAPTAATKPRPTVQPTVTIASTAATPATKPAYKGSGFQPWTAEWAAWCARYFPRSWDPATGTVVHGSSTTGERVLCK
jgi:hypothetical protein